MNEQLLHFIWKFRLYNPQHLVTANGEEVVIYQPGIHNTHAGPDFEQARISINGTQWAGNIEIHVNEAEWSQHGHQQDAAYNNVILHVVYSGNGKQTFTAAGAQVPVLVLGNRIQQHTLQRYRLLAENKRKIPCHSFLSDVADITWMQVKERMLTGRLQNKVAHIRHLLDESTNNWNHVFYRLVARYMGGTVNREAMEQLFTHVSPDILARYVNNPMQIEALLFGASGFLEEEPADAYQTDLRKEFNYLKRLHRITPMPAERWKFLRLRPASFPTLRLAQLSVLLQSHPSLFMQMVHEQDATKLTHWLMVEASGYWKTHYRFGVPAQKVPVKVGEKTAHSILINALAPALFAFGKYKGEDALCERAVALLQQLPAEQNAIIKTWAAMHVTCSNAADSQALIELQTNQCTKFACLQCAIGHKVLG